MKKIMLWLMCCVLRGVQCTFAGEIDLQYFNTIRLEKVNALRSDAWIDYQYKLNGDLMRTAQGRSDYSLSIGNISHKKYGSQSYYDYKLIQKYVESNGIQFADKAWTKVVENIGWWVVHCKETDCTDEIIKATESTRKFFLSEKWKSYAPHYKSMISTHYTDAWFGVSVNWKTGKYFFTAYYSIPTLNSTVLESKETQISDTLAPQIVTETKHPRIIRRRA